MNYIQPNLNTTDFAFSQLNNKPANSSSTENSLSGLSFADALKAAYKSEKTEKTEAEKQPQTEEYKVSKQDDSSKKVEEKQESPKVEEKTKTDDEKIAKDTEKVSKDSESEENDEEIANSNVDKIVVANNSQDKENLIENIEGNSELSIDLDSKIASSNNNSNLESETFDVDSENIDIESLISAKIAQNDLTEENVQSEKLQSFENVSDAQINNVVNNTNKTKNTKNEKNGLEKINVYDHRTQKVDSENLANAQKTVKVVATKSTKEENSKNDSKNQKSESKNIVAKNNILNVNQNVKTPKVTQNELKVAYNQETQDSTQLTMELSAQVTQNITSSSSQTAAATGSDFQQMLSNTVQHNASEFVKAGNIVLKDNNQGTINLIMKPESLGNVKISLSLSDKTISGQIIVSSKEAYDAFRENIDAIRQAFTESGFDTGSFDLSFSNQESFAQNQDSNSNDANQKNAIANADRVYGDLVSDSDETVSSSKNDGHSVHIVA